MWISRASLLPTALCLAWPVAAEAPLSAIDWLSQSVATPATLPRPQPQTGSGHPTSPLSSSGPITVTPLGQVIDVEITRSSGYIEIDAAVESALINCVYSRIEGKKNQIGTVYYRFPLEKRD